MEMFALLIFIIVSLSLCTGVMLALVGATGSTAVSYILPGGFYYMLHKDKPACEAPTWKLYAALAQFTLGCILVPTCLTLIFIGAGSE